ncbi:hypothetical protein Barb6XT_01402 [Bacteroidales bacterium Barb6XT]|nr:hypothetical protein Barb6XT_01402 [Bacteroidales bacterium Barb6XT]
MLRRCPCFYDSHKRIAIIFLIILIISDYGKYNSFALTAFKADIALIRFAMVRNTDKFTVANIMFILQKQKISLLFLSYMTKENSYPSGLTRFTCLLQIAIIFYSRALSVKDSLYLKDDWYFLR